MSNFSYFEFAKRHSVWINLFLIIISTTFTFLLCEGLFRVYLHWFKPPFVEETERIDRILGSGSYTPLFKDHPFLSFARSDTVLKPEGIHIGKDFFTQEKPAGVIRVACLGGSTTMYTYPRELSLYLNLLPYPAKFEVMNFGCVSWTSMESLVNYLIRVSYFKPDIVLIHHGINDGPALHWDTFKADYTHYRRTWQEREIGDVEFFALTHSRLLSYCLFRLGRSPFDLHGRVIWDIDPAHHLPKMNPEGLQVYGENIRKIVQRARAGGGKVIMAPMAYNRKASFAGEDNLIEECNRTARRVAQEMGIPLAETDALLKDRPEMYKDLVHVTDAGQYAKAQVFTQVIWHMLQNGEAETAQQPFEPLWENGRDVELCWEFESDQVKDFHVQVQLNWDKKFRYLGRTGSAKIKNYRWKCGEPELAPILHENFRSGPQYGTHYFFRIVAIDKNNKAIARITHREGLKAVEHERTGE